MSNPPNEPARFVTCPCQHCNGSIEFDAAQLEIYEIREVECPHCHQSALVFVPILSQASPQEIFCWLKTILRRAARKMMVQLDEDAVELIAHCFQSSPMGAIGFLKILGDAGQKRVTPGLVRAAVLEILQREQKEEAQETISRQAISSEVRREVWRRDQGKCVKCGSRANLEYDHIIPVARGGGNTARNIELLCEACNRAKSNLIQ
jgi:Zn finger protein HypA/HybF involved in hydrogenase expression